MALTTYTELRTALAQNWPNRSDLTGRDAEFIALAEASFKRDHRFRKLAVQDITVSADALTLPSDLREVESWAYNDGSHFGEIDLVDYGALSTYKGRYGTTGTPRCAAIVNGVAYFGPAPDQSYATRFAYWRKITALSDSVSSNWLLAAHPDAYLYGSLIHLEGFMKNDPRILTWKTLYEEIAEQIAEDADRQQWGGSLTMQTRVIG
jgi:hypothetical protein